MAANAGGSGAARCLCAHAASVDVGLTVFCRYTPDRVAVRLSDGVSVARLLVVLCS